MSTSSSDPDADGFRKVADASDLKPGEGLGVDVNGIEIALFNVEGELYAISNRCGHQRAPLCKVGKKKINGDKCWTDRLGGIDEGAPSIACPWHLWEWNLETGENPVSGKRISTFDVKAEDGDVLVRI